MVDIRKLKAKLVEQGSNVEELASKIGMDKSTLYRRFANNGESFTIGEADAISKELNLSGDEVNAIFFAQYVA